VAADSLFFNGDRVFDTATGAMLGKGISTSTVTVTADGVIYARATAILTSAFTRQEVVDRKGNKSMATVLSKPVALMNTPHR